MMMTREEAVRELEFLASCSYVDRFEPTEEEALKMAIKALEQEPCDDAISRQAVLDMLENINAETEGVGFYYEHYVDYIKSLPSVKPQEKTGYWRPIYQGDEIIGYRCSECEFGRTRNTHRANYCHNCGIKMRKKSTENSEVMTRAYQKGYYDAMKQVNREQKSQATDFLAEARACAESEVQE